MPKQIHKLKDLTPDLQNANKGTERGTALLEKSIRDFGFGRAILVDREGRILAGNKSLEAAASVGIDKVEVIQTDGRKIIAVQRMDLDLAKDKHARALALADNRVAELNLTWNLELLPQQIAELEELGMSQFFNEKEIAKLLDDADMPSMSDVPEPQFDKAAELQQKWKTARGQIWEIGKHRLLCGDAFSSWQALLNSAQITLVLTDPPYGVNVDYGEIIDDAETVGRIICHVLPRLRKFPVVLLTCGQRMLWSYPKASWLLAWVHPAGVGTCPWGFVCLNPILAYGDDPYLRAGKGSRADCLVLDADRQRVEGHPAPKPIAVWKWLLERGSAEVGETIFDPFIGSGTTMVAAEHLRRACYGIEIEPKYVAVALERMADMGLEPKLVGAGADGR